MGFFEQYPVLLVPIIIVTVEVWAAVKRFASARNWGIASWGRRGSAR